MRSKITFIARQLTHRNAQCRFEKKKRLQLSNFLYVKNFNGAPIRQQWFLCQDRAEWTLWTCCILLVRVKYNNNKQFTTRYFSSSDEGININKISN